MVTIDVASVHADLFRAKRFRATMHKGTFPRAAIRARKHTLVHRRAETLRAEKIGASLTIDWLRVTEWRGSKLESEYIA